MCICLGCSGNDLKFLSLSVHEFYSFSGAVFIGLFWFAPGNSSCLVSAFTCVIHLICPAALSVSLFKFTIKYHCLYLVWVYSQSNIVHPSGSPGGACAIWMWSMWWPEVQSGLWPFALCCPTIKSNALKNIWLDHVLSSGVMRAPWMGTWAARGTCTTGVEEHPWPRVKEEAWPHWTAPYGNLRVLAGGVSQSYQKSSPCSTTGSTPSRATQQLTYSISLTRMIK